MDKGQIRKDLIEKRKNIDYSKKMLYDIEMSRKITELELFKRADRVLLFASTEDEFNTKYIDAVCRALKKEVYYPRCEDRNGNMSFYKVDSKGQLVLGYFGIREPIKGLTKFNPAQKGLCIVPALSVDWDFNRIGYGKGYYDRFLRSFRGVSLCPCYRELISEKLPCEDTDVKVDIVVTQDAIRRLNRG